MTETVWVAGYADNRPLACRDKGKREPLVQVLASHYGDVHSFSFAPGMAPALAEAILKAARSAKRGRDIEFQFEVKD